MSKIASAGQTMQSDSTSAMRIVRTEVAEGFLTWRVQGEGYPVLLLHGGGGSWTHWRRNMEPLSRRYTVFAPDLPGFGDSAHLRPVDFQTLTAQVVAGIDELRLDQFVIVAFSLGTLVGAGLLDHYRDRIAHFILVGSFSLAGWTSVAARLRKWRGTASAAERFEAHRHNLSVLMLHDAAKIDDLTVSLHAANTERSFRAWRAQPDGSDLLTPLRRWRPRLSAIWGAEDRLVKGRFDEHRRVLVDIDPVAESELVSDAGHWVQYEAADYFNAWLIQTLGRPIAP
jgi:2-hydroxy-6-oxonona-2,4-dienedioate hydrolase